MPSELADAKLGSSMAAGALSSVAARFIVRECPCNLRRHLKEYVPPGKQFESFLVGTRCSRMPDFVSDYGSVTCPFIKLGSSRNRFRTGLARLLS